MQWEYDMTSSIKYSPIDRMMHNLAFGSKALQEIMEGIENSILAGRWAEACAERPIFIASLPRAGTTIILEALCQLPGMASHTYRDMPFILTPVLWDRISSGMRYQGKKRERAHGDGLLVNADSPEAFEEVLWRKYYGHKYTNEGIMLWQVDDVDEVFVHKFRNHMKKIVALRQPACMKNSRYLSKNNGNIARIEVLRTMFPDACIVVPFRHPLEHAISLWKQHRNFNQLHAVEPFSYKYMADLGHYEFGGLHRPVIFADLKTLSNELDPESIDYWLAYWVATFEYLSALEGINYISYESLCTAGVEGMKRLCRQLDVTAEGEDVLRAASVFHKPPESRCCNYNISKDLTERAMNQYNILIKQCLLRSTS